MERPQADRQDFHGLQHECPWQDPERRLFAQRRPRRASVYAAAGAVLSFFGFIHGAELGFAVSWQVALGYLFLSGILLWVGRQEGALRPQ